jgi:hypothetical protein
MKIRSGMKILSIILTVMFIFEMSTSITSGCVPDITVLQE